MIPKKIFLVLLFISLNSHADNWTYLAKSPSGNQSYALAIVSPSLFPTLWYKTTDNKGKTLSISKDVIDCKKNNFSIKEITYYNTKGNVENKNSYFFNSWVEITPDSLAEYEYKFACHHSFIL